MAGARRTRRRRPPPRLCAANAQGRRCAPGLVALPGPLLLLLLGCCVQAPSAAAAPASPLVHSDLHIHASGAVWAEDYVDAAAAAGGWVCPTSLAVAANASVGAAADGTCAWAELAAALAAEPTLRQRLLEAWSMLNFEPRPGRTAWDHFADVRACWLGKAAGCPWRQAARAAAGSCPQHTQQQAASSVPAPHPPPAPTQVFARIGFALAADERGHYQRVALAAAADGISYLELQSEGLAAPPLPAEAAAWDAQLARLAAVHDAAGMQAALAALEPRLLALPGFAASVELLARRLEALHAGLEAASGVVVRIQVFLVR